MGRVRRQPYSGLTEGDNPTVEIFAYAFKSELLEVVRPIGPGPLLADLVTSVEGYTLRIRLAEPEEDRHIIDWWRTDLRRLQSRRGF